MKILVGIDPGKKGGIALSLNGELGVFPTPLLKGELDIKEMVSLIPPMINIDTTHIAFIEAVHSMPAQGVTSMFTFGKGYGIWIGILAAYGYTINYVRPQVWKKYFKLGKDKEDSIKKAKELYSYINLIPPRARKESDGMAEALLILHYGQNNKT